jgi:hypothetical protein
MGSANMSASRLITVWQDPKIKFGFRVSFTGIKQAENIH